MEPQNSIIYALVTDGIYIGNINSAKDLVFLANADISAIINLSGVYNDPVEDVDCFDFLLPSQELLDSEIPMTVKKLETIATTIADLRARNRTVLIHCIDGKNKCPLCAGYFLIKYCGYGAEIIERLRNLYAGTDAGFECLTSASSRKILRSLLSEK